MTLSEQVKQIERDRQAREDELLLLLLLMARRAEREAVFALNNGFPVQTVLSNVLLGRDRTGGVIPVISGSQADAHGDAFRRLSRVTGRPITRADAGDYEALRRLYVAGAAAAGESMVRTLSDAIRDELADASQSALKAVRAAFERVGYTKSSSYGLELGAERAIVGAYNGGMIDAAGATGIALGLRHVSVIDERTTDICRERDGLTLPASDVYWQTNCPSLHNHCRSILAVVGDDFDESDWRPRIPPAPGFGRAPLDFFQRYRRAA